MGFLLFLRVISIFLSDTSGGGSEFVGKIFWLCFWCFSKGGSRYTSRLSFRFCVSWIRLFFLISLGGIRSCLWIAWLSHARLAAFSSGSFSLFLPTLSMVFRGSCNGLIFSVSESLLPAFFFHNIMKDKVLNGWFIVPKVLNFLGGSPKLLEEMLRGCEQHPGKSAPFHLFSLSYDGEYFNGMFILFQICFV